jgi:acid phosphatase
MWRSFGFFLVFLGAAGLTATGGDAPPAKATAAIVAWLSDLPKYDHVVIVVEENKDYEQIIDDPTTDNEHSKAPYINNTLRAEGANFTKMFGEEHNSQGNYFWLFSGSNQNVGFDDHLPPMMDKPNLGAALIAKGLSFKGYAEDLPEISSPVEFFPKHGRIYARKHVPWISFTNVPHGNTIDTSACLRFKDFPAGTDSFDSLPTVAFVIPNLKNDMHDQVPPPGSIRTGDRWLEDHLNAYYQWAKTHNSLLIVTWDESDLQDKDPVTGADASIPLGPTDPAVQGTDQRSRNRRNQIATIFAGARVKHGDYAEGKGINHVSILRTLEAMYGLPRAGHQQAEAENAGVSDDFVVADVFTAQ